MRKWRLIKQVATILRKTAPFPMTIREAVEAAHDSVTEYYQGA